MDLRDLKICSLVVDSEKSQVGWAQLYRAHHSVNKKRGMKCPFDSCLLQSVAHAHRVFEYAAKHRTTLFKSNVDLLT